MTRETAMPVTRITL